jgi:hypothetical protein
VSIIILVIHIYIYFTGSKTAYSLPILDPGIIPGPPIKPAPTLDKILP